jgi:hypothetical protein
VEVSVEVAVVVTVLVAVCVEVTVEVIVEVTGGSEVVEALELVVDVVDPPLQSVVPAVRPPSEPPTTISSLPRAEF